MSDASDKSSAGEPSANESTRRRVLSAVGGVSLTGPLMPGVDIAWGPNTENSDRVEYVERLRHTNPKEVRENGAKPEREPVTDTISRDHWLVTETAHDARASVQESIEQLTTHPLVMTGVTTITDGGQRKKAVTVDHITREGEESVRSPDVSFDRLKGILPDTVSGEVDGTTIDGIPVVSREQTYYDTVSCDGYDYTASFGNSIPGASKIEIGCGSCSFGAPAYDDSADQRRMLTGGHCLNEDDLVQQPACFTHGDGYGDQVRDPSGADFASVRAPDDHDGWEIYKKRLADDGGDFYPDRYISGRLNDSTIKYNEGDTSYTVYNHGARTGRTSGHITEIKTNSDGHKVVWTSAQNGGGDSGCPIYKEYYNGSNYRVYIAGISVWGAGGDPGSDSCPYDKSGGNTMEYIEDQLGVTV